MNVQVDFWQLVGLLLGFLGACATAGKMLLAQTKQHIDSQFAAQEKARVSGHEQLAKRLDSIESVNRDETLQWQRVERELLSMKAELPLNYVRREDYIRGQSVIEAKLDGLGTKIENAQLRARST